MTASATACTNARSCAARTTADPVDAARARVDRKARTDAASSAAVASSTRTSGVELESRSERRSPPLAAGRLAEPPVQERLERECVDEAHPARLRLHPVQPGHQHQQLMHGDRRGPSGSSGTVPTARAAASDPA